jgi:hypothetical protein
VTGCLTYLLFVAAGVLLIVSVIRWFEQTAEAVENRWWHKLLLLVLVPPSVWLFPSKYAAGRPGAVPRHSPVMGFGGLPGPKRIAPDDGPPPGTPKEFLELPKIPPKRPSAQSAVDPDKLAKLREKMRQQGMLDEDDAGGSGGGD